ncbi:MAG: cadherin repeat domain-containing protein [Chloroflexota bacterium]|nr:cadherin repeat domain-containing protein [Chloroflexota bacterium]MDQ5867390.1 cadherin repeat domain-containing protein [Chloroflexota bacterium]
MTRKIKFLTGLIAMGLLAVLWGAVSIASTPPVEMQTACVQDSSGKISYLGSGACGSGETKITFSAANPTLACATGVDKKVFRVTSAAQCTNPNILLTLPNVTSEVYFCSKNSNKDLRYVLGPGECKSNETSVYVKKANQAPTNITLSNSSVAENEPAGTTVGTFTTTDPDAGDTHTYGLVPGAGDADNASFQVSGSTLKTAAPLDYDAKPSYSIRVQTNDGKGGIYEKQFTITATNVNEAPTDIALSNASVAENQAAGTTVGNLSTTDPDAGNTHTYALVAGAGDTDNASFQVAGSTLKTAASFNFEAKSSYSVRVRSTDAGGLNTEKAFTISVTNVNEAPTDISLSSQSVDEDQPAGTTVGNLGTDDPDAGGTHTYALVAGAGDADNASFQVAGSALKTNQVFHWESKSSYTIRVRSTDAGGLFTEKQFTITVNHLNHAPTNISLSNSSVAENQAAGTTVGTFSTTDPDSIDSHTYSLVSGAGADDNASFQVTGSTLKTTASFDFEAKSSYSIRVKTDDGNGSSFEKAFTISVTNANEAPTDIELSNDSVDENQAAGTAVGTLSTDDPDASDTHTYALVAGAGSTDNASFQVVGDALKTAASFNFEGKSSYSVRVRSTDAGGLNTEKAFTVTVSDVNEAPSNIALSNNDVDEKAPVGTLVGDFSTTDQDSGDTHAYTLVAGTGDADNGSFQIASNQLQTAEVFTYANKSSYTIRVRSTDFGGLFTEKQFTINVNPLNRPPVNSVPGAQTANEDTDLVFSTANGNAISVSDPDAGTGNVKVSLEVLSGTLTYPTTAGLTFVDGTSNGQASVNVTGSIANINAALNGLKYKGDPNFNSTRGAESLTVVTNDQSASAGGPLFDSDSVSITVNAVNDKPAATGKSFQVQANMPRSMGGLLAGATDANDADDAGYTPSFTLVDVVADNCPGCTISNVNSAADTFDFSPPPGGTGSYTLKYRVADSGNPAPGATSDYATITVTVNGPVIWFVNPVAATNGDGRLGTPFNSIAAVDAVDAANHRIFLYSGTTTGDIDLNTGEWLVGQGVSGSSFDSVFGITPPAGTAARPPVGGTKPTLQGHVGMDSNSAVRGLNVNAATGVAITANTVSNLTIGEAGVTSGNASSVTFVNVTGSVSVSSSSFTAGSGDNFSVINASGTLDRITFDNVTIGTNGATGNDGLVFRVSGSAILKATVQNSTFTAARSHGVEVAASGSSVVDFVFTGNAVSNNHPSIVTGASNVLVGTGGSALSANVTYNISNNTLRDASGGAIVVGKGAVGAGDVSGTIANNTIGVSGVGNSGSTHGSGIVVGIQGGGSHSATIANNTIVQFTNFGILVQGGNTTSGGGQGRMTAVIKGNVVSQPSANSSSGGFPTSGLRVTAGTNTGDNTKFCLTLGGAATDRNTLTGTGTNFAQDIRLVQSRLVSLAVTGYPGAANDNTAMQTYLLSQNVAATAGASNNVSAGGPGYSGTCTP